MLSPWLGDGLLLSFGVRWHAKRKIITPTFHFKILEQYVEIFEQNAEKFVKQLDRKYSEVESCATSDKDKQLSLNIYPLVCLSALDIIAETAMGVTINALEQPDLPYVKALARYQVSLYNYFVNYSIVSLFIDKFYYVVLF